MIHIQPLEAIIRRHNVKNLITRELINFREVSY